MLHNHEALLCRVRQDLPTDELLSDLSDLFKIFGDTTRCKILYALFESEMCVCAIAELLGMTQSAISHQLRILKDADLVGKRREGKTIYYFLSDDHVRTIIAQGFEHFIKCLLTKVLDTNVASLVIHHVMSVNTFCIDVTTHNGKIL